MDLIPGWELRFRMLEGTACPQEKKIHVNFLLFNVATEKFYMWLTVFLLEGAALLIYGVVY